MEYLMLLLPVYWIFEFIYKFYFKKINIRYMQSNGEWYYLTIKERDIHHYTLNDQFEVL